MFLNKNEMFFLLGGSGDRMVGRGLSLHHVSTDGTLRKQLYRGSSQETMAMTQEL
jgi:hypothetical protein